MTAVYDRLVQGRKTLRVGFRTSARQSTGAVFEVRIVRPAVSPGP